MLHTLKQSGVREKFQRGTEKLSRLFKKSPDFVCCEAFRPFARTDRHTGRAGLTGEEVAEGRLMPTALTAITLKTYAVPLMRPVATYDVRVDTGLAIRVQVVPPLVERLTM